MAPAVAWALRRPFPPPGLFRSLLRPAGHETRDDGRTPHQALFFPSPGAPPALTDTRGWSSGKGMGLEETEARQGVIFGGSQPSALQLSCPSCPDDPPPPGQLLPSLPRQEAGDFPALLGRQSLIVFP